eukprot:12417855-Karenia_brevis.AAC.2
MAPRADIVHFLAGRDGCVEADVQAKGSKCCMSSNNGATRCHCPPFWQAEMAALKLITSSKRLQL